MNSHHPPGSLPGTPSGALIEGALPVAPSLGPTLDAAHMPTEARTIDGRVAWVSGLAIAISLVAAFAAQLLTRLIGLITNLAFYGRLSTAFVSPANNHLGAAMVLVPVAGGVLVGLMARYGSKAIRGHGIPEAMETVLTNQSRIPARLTFLKPLSAAISIGSGGPFGAEGRSSPRAARWARSWVRSAGRRRSSARRCWRRAPPPEWRRPSVAPSRPPCSPSSCFCSSCARGR